jgi:CRP/FNR family cyclic AMP-dependent transcriptional regulator
MINGPDVKKKFVFALQDNSEAIWFQATVQSHVSHAQFIQATDGADALSKMHNDTPSVLVISKELQKLSTNSLVQTVLNEPKFRDIGIVIISEIPEEEFFVDAVAIGRIQFLSKDATPKAFSQVIAKALNFAFRKEDHIFKLRFLSAGEILLKQGDAADNVYIVKRGSLKAVVNNPTETELGKISEGEFVGEMAYITHRNRSADVVAISDCELIVIPIDHLDHLLFQKPAWAKALMQTLSRRLLEANQRAS